MHACESIEAKNTIDEKRLQTKQCYFRNASKHKLWLIKQADDIFVE